MATTWRWLDLGAVDGATMVNVFVALARPVAEGRSPPTAFVLYPERPFANVGFHQEAEREVDIPYCRANGIPVVRRVVGGGAILDGPWEHDYMVVVPPGAPDELPDPPMGGPIADSVSGMLWLRRTSTT